MVWWPFLLGITCDLVAKQRLLPSQKLGEPNYPQLFIGTNPDAESSLRLLGFFAWGPFDFWCALWQDAQ